MASPQIPLVTVPLKRTDEIDWVKPLKRHIALVYQDDPEKYNNETTALNSLRQHAMAAVNDNTGRDTLYRYFGQLELLDLRFLFDEKNVRILFNWYDAFDNKATGQYSLAYEKASVLFNMAATLSGIAANQNRAETEGRKRAFNFLQVAAGIFQYINDNFLHAPSKDLNKDTVHMLVELMLAQAHECFLESSISEKKKEGLVAKLASHASWAYGNLVDLVQENMDRGVAIHNSWLSLCKLKHKLYQAQSQYYKAAMCEKESQYGDHVARLASAEAAAKEAAKIASALKPLVSGSQANASLPTESGSTLLGLCKSLTDVCGEKHAKAERENDMIYHEPVPKESILASIDRLSLVKPMPISELYGNSVGSVVGADIFTRLIPLSVHESASIFSEEKAKLLRSCTEECELAESELSVALHELKLPGALRMFKNNHFTTPPEEVRALADIISVDEAADSSSIDDLMTQMARNKSDAAQALEKVDSLLQQEKRDWESMHGQHGHLWLQTPSAQAAGGFDRDFRGYRGALEKATASDGQLFQRYGSVKRDIALLAKGGSSKDLQDLFANLSSSLPEDRNNLLDLQVETGSTGDLDHKVTQVEGLIDKLRKIEKDRKESLESLREETHKDDSISQTLILNKRANVEEQIFAAGLERFRPYQQRITETVRRQQELIKELVDMFKQMMEDPDALRLQTHAETLVKRLKQAKDSYFEIKPKLGQGARFYADLVNAARTLSSRTCMFTEDRARERERLVLTMASQKNLQEQVNLNMPASASSNISPSAPPSIPEIEKLASQMSFQSPTCQNPLPIRPAFSASGLSNAPPSSAHYQPPPAHYSEPEPYAPGSGSMQHHMPTNSRPQEPTFTPTGYSPAQPPLQYRPSPLNVSDGYLPSQSPQQQQQPSWSNQSPSTMSQPPQPPQPHPWEQQPGHSSLMD